MRARVLAAGVAAALCLASGAARAGGFYVTDRGVRPLGRGGAFVAGADDQHAVWYNPAGLVAGGNGLLVDASLVMFSSTYTRTAQAAGGPEVALPPVEGASAPLPIPTLVLSHNFGARDFMFAAGVYAPYAAIAHYPDARDAPQRYSLVNMEGSLLAIAGLWAAWRPHPNFSVGAGVQALLGNFVSTLALSGCPATITCAPEDPDWDALAQLRVGPIVAPTGNVGVRFTPHPLVAFGASFQLPLRVSAPATLGVRLPSASYYEGARVEGDQAHVQFDLAPVARVGVEFRPTPATRIEVAGVWEGWREHDAIALTPQGVRITGVRGVGTYDVGPVALERRFEDVFSLRLGAEQAFDVATGWRVVARAGAMLETSATAPEYTNVLTLDADKLVASLGATLSHAAWRIDLVVARSFTSTVVVAPVDARIYQTAPFRQGPQAPRHAINGGTYEHAVNVLGLGLQYRF